MRHVLWIFVVMVFVSCSTKSTDNQETENIDSLHREQEEKPDEKKEVLRKELKILVFDKKETTKLSDLKGNVLYGYKWEDTNGNNLLVFTKDINKELWENSEGCDDCAFFTTHLRVYHFADKNSGQYQLLRKIKDWNQNKCGSPPFKHEADFHTNSIAITDLDKDGYAEATFMYYFLCASEIHPENTKLMMIENGDKYAIRGDSYIPHYYEDSGVKEFDPSFNDAPAELKKYASQIWEKCTSTRKNKGKYKSDKMLNEEYLINTVWELQYISKSKANLTTPGSSSPIACDLEEKSQNVLPSKIEFSERAIIDCHFKDQKLNMYSTWDMLNYPDILLEYDEKYSLTYEEGIIYGKSVAAKEGNNLVWYEGVYKKL